MIRIAKSDHGNSQSPRIDSITPEAVLPGGEVELAGSALGPVAERRPLAVLDGWLNRGVDNSTTFGTSFDSHHGRLALGRRCERGSAWTRRGSS